MSEIEIDLVKKFEDFMIIHQNQPGKKLPPHHHPEYQVIIPLQGEIALEVDHNKLTLGPGSMVFVPSEVSHSFYSSAKKGERLIFYLDPKLLNKKSKCFQQTRILSSNQLLIELLFHCLLHFESKIIPILKNTLIGLLEELLNDEKSTPLISTDTLLRKTSDDRLIGALTLLMNNFEESPSMEEVAKSSGMSLRTMNRLFLKEFQQSPKQILNQIRIQKSISLFSSSKRSVTEVALMVGFQSTSRFIETFRRLTGQLPSQVRRFGWKEP